MENKHRKVWKVISRKTNTAKRKNTFLKTKSNFSLTRKCFLLIGKCFPLTNFSNGKQTQESLESNFLKTIFQKTNMILNTVLEHGPGEKYDPPTCSCKCWIKISCNNAKGIK